MAIRLIDEGWDKEFAEALSADAGELRIICPFMKVSVLESLLGYRPDSVQVITRFNLPDFAEGVSDVAALRKLVDTDAKVRGVRNLHAKLYLFGASRAIITSANLTKAALSRNYEFGMVAEDATIIADCRAYFDKLWQRAGNNLRRDQVDAWDETVTAHRLRGGRLNQTAGLDDFGVDAGFADPPPARVPTVVADASQAFVKLLGKADNRIPLSSCIIDELEGAGCHWAAYYPRAKRPRSVRNDDVIFMGQLTLNPDDIRIFGRAIEMKYELGRDDATAADITRRPWKKDWPRYIRVRQAEFVAGTMENGISLNELMEALSADSLASTQLNVARCEGNINPRRAYSQQAAVKLSDEGRSWLDERLQVAFEAHGKITQDALDKLDWPDLPTLTS